MAEPVYITKRTGILSASYDGLYQRRTLPDSILYGFNNVIISGGYVVFENPCEFIADGRLVYIPTNTRIQLGSSSDVYLIATLKDLEVSLTFTSSISSLTKNDLNVQSISDPSYQVPLGKIENSAFTTILPRANYGGIFYGTGEPPTDYDYEDGCLYIKYNP